MNRCIAAVSAAIFIIFVIAFIFTLNSEMQVNSTIDTNRCIPDVIIDPGHGGEDGGTSSDDGILEKDINLSVSKRLAVMLESVGYNVILTRSADEQIGNNSLPTIRQRKISDIRQRLEIAHNNPDALFVSIHQNHYDNSKYHGAQVFYSPKSSESKQLAQCIQGAVSNLIQPENKRNVKEVGSNIYLLYNCINTSVMVECGFMSNYSEAKMLQNEDYQTKLAFSIMCGIINFLEEDYGQG
jgi:N-acetylmuramoyl-L-alanine amidase